MFVWMETIEGGFIYIYGNGKHIFSPSIKENSIFLFFLAFASLNLCSLPFVEEFFQEIFG